MSPGQSSRALRVVQWSTGNIGSRSLRTVIEHPRLDLVGVHVHSPEKAGRDAGELSGLDPIGVVATTSIDDVLALKPDCVLYMARSTDLEDVCRLLAAGINIVTTRGDFHFPDHMDPEVRSRVEEACRQGGTSIHSTGSSPGFISEALPLVLTSLQRRLDRVVIDEFADMSRRDSPAMIFEIMGYGQPASVFDEGRLDMLRDSFAGSLYLVAEALSMPLDEVTAIGEFAMAKETIKIAAGTIQAGTVAAQRITVSGIRNGSTLLQFRANWARVTSTSTGNCARTAGGFKSPETPHSTSRFAFPFRSRTIPRSCRA
jgi:hypothetical protein